MEELKNNFTKGYEGTNPEANAVDSEVDPKNKGLGHAKMLYDEEYGKEYDKEKQNKQEGALNTKEEKKQQKEQQQPTTNNQQPKTKGKPLNPF